MVRLPLEGIRVIDLSEVWAGPMGASLLGDMGAQVIKVESYPRAPQTRPPVPPASSLGFAGQGTDVSRPWDRAAVHNMANRNKYGITLNLREPRGKELFVELVALSDVLIEGYSAGTAERLGLDYPVLRGVNPALVMISMPGWGTVGPYQGYVTLGSGIDSTSGHHYLRGYPDADPSQTMACVHSDAVAAVTAAYAALTGLFYRRRSGRGQWIDLSQAEAFLPHLGYSLLDYAMNRRGAQPLGNHDRWMAPHSCYPCRGEEEWIAICVSTDQEWQALCRAAGHLEWQEDPRFSGVDDRWRNQDALDALISQWTQEQDKRELAERLQQAGVPAGAVLRDVELFEDAHLARRGAFEEATHKVVGRTRNPGMLWKYSETPLRLRLAPNALAEHNALVFRQLLGLSSDQCQALEAQGVTGDTYAPEASLDARDQAMAPAVSVQA
ncbi:MAG: CoA transferase [Chloroflexi bacterium]|nr:CoA transferase [Chloroflexota bacterium]